MSDRFFLLTLCCVSAALSAGAVLTLAPHRDTELATTLELETAQSPADASPRATVRPLLRPSTMGGTDDLAFVPADGLPSMAPSGANEQVAEISKFETIVADAIDAADAEQVATEDAEFWSAVTREAPPKLVSGPRLAALPERRVTMKAPTLTSFAPDASLQKRLSEISPGASKRLEEKFFAAGAAWPPADIGLVAIKDQKVVELFARAAGAPWKLIHRYPVLAASGTSGPKLRQGDRQVPEGVYSISYLNPNSKYHVALRVDYPNVFDKRMAEKDGRGNLGGDIMIHGNAKSVGCLAIGDTAAEELFVLAARVGLPKIKLIIAPTDFRDTGVPDNAPGQPEWVPKLYTQVASAMTEFKGPPKSLLSFFGKW